MHALSHTLSHRGTSATRARSRWQPYSVTLPSNANSPIAYLYTPASSVTSSPPTTFANPVCNPDSTQGLTASARRVLPPRETSRSRYAALLVDQAVRSLCDTWHPEDIPLSFRIPSSELPRGAPSIEQERDRRALNEMASRPRNVQLPSPISPSTQHSPEVLLSCDTPRKITHRPLVPPTDARNHLLPIRVFVHEVLRRSRTSTGVLQTALCYLEAIRLKLPELIHKEKMQESDPNRSQNYPDLLPAIVEEHSYAEFNTVTQDSNKGFCYAGPPTDGRPDFDMLSATGAAIPGTPASISQDDSKVDPACGPSWQPSSHHSLPPLPPLPSPLLCPRRTFLACLILASKFMQDRSYSNRAWAKLAGLPPREIGRCERAVGDALEWRLWVGKEIRTAAKPKNSRNVMRTQSDGALLPEALNSSNAPWLKPPTVYNSYDSGALHTASPFPPVPLPVQRLRTPAHSGLHRHASLPELQPCPPDISLGNRSQCLSHDLFDMSSASLAPAALLQVDEQDCSVRAQYSEGPLYASPASLSTPPLSDSPSSTSSERADEATMMFSCPLTPSVSTHMPVSSARYDRPAHKIADDVEDSKMS